MPATGNRYPEKDRIKMSMTRDAYAKEVLRVAEAALYGGESVLCPHEGCQERLSIVKQGVLSTRSISCPVHGHIFQEQRVEPFSKLEWHEAPETVDDDDDECFEERDLIESEYASFEVLVND